MPRRRAASGMGTYSVANGRSSANSTGHPLAGCSGRYLPGGSGRCRHVSGGGMGLSVAGGAQGDQVAGQLVADPLIREVVDFRRLGAVAPLAPATGAVEHLGTLQDP